MKKRISAILVCAVMMVSLCCAAFAEETGVKTYTLSLDDAINMMLENDPALISADIKIKDAERQLQQARKNQKDMKGVAVRVSSGISGLALQRGYYVKQAEMGLESAKFEKKQTIASSSYAITQQYYGVKLAERLLASAESAYSLALNNKNTMDTQLSLGMVSEIDVNNASYALNQAKAARDKYARNLELARKNFAVRIFIEDDKFVLNLTDDIEFEEFETQLEEDIKKALETRYDVFMLKTSLNLAELMESVAKHFGLSSAEYSSAHQSKVQSEVTYNNSSKLIGISINSSYNAILDAKDSLKLAEENLALCQQEYNVGVIQHELGMITNTQLTGIMNSVAAAQIELDNAKLSYKLAVEKYGYEITVGLGQ